MIAAVDIGGTKIAVGLVGEGGLLAEATFPTAASAGYADGLARIKRHLEILLAERSPAAPRGIGIGCTGRHDITTGRLQDVASFLPGWNDAPIGDDLSRHFGVPATLENDADAAAVGEWALGSGAGCRRFIYLTVSTGIGGGIILNGQLYRGVGAAHPEIGHHVIAAGEHTCFCGARGCWESLASGPAMARRWRIDQPHEPALAAQEICARAAGGDPAALQAVEREAFYLGTGLANLITLFAPDVIALGGGVMNSYPLFEQGVRETIAAQCGLVPWRRVRIIPAQLGGAVALVGAAHAWALRHSSSVSLRAPVEDGAEE